MSASLQFVQNSKAFLKAQQGLATEAIVECQVSRLQSKLAFKHYRARRGHWTSGRSDRWGLLQRCTSRGPTGGNQHGNLEQRVRPSDTAVHARDHPYASVSHRKGCGRHARIVRQSRVEWLSYK